MLKLLLIEPHTTGHHMQYVRRIIAEGNHWKIRIQLLTSRASLNHKSYQAMQEELAGQFETAFLPPDVLATQLLKSGGLLAQQFGYYRQFQRFFRQLSASERPDIVFLPYLDYIDKAVSILGSPFGRTSWSGLPMQYKFHYTTMGALRPAERSDNLKKKVYLRLLNNASLQSMFTIDELLYEYTKQYYPVLAEKLHYVGEPVDIVSRETRSAVRQRLGVPESRKVLLIYGVLSGRKGIQSLLSSMQQARFPQEVCLLLAGPQQKDIEHLLQSPDVQQLRRQNRIFAVNEYLMGEDEGDMFRAADMVWLGYKDFYGMSAVMIQAGHMGLPIIACREGLIGWMVRKHQTGLDINIESPHEIIDAINCLVEKPELAAYYGSNGEALSANFTSEAFTKTICATLTAGSVNHSKALIG